MHRAMMRDMIVRSVDKARNDFDNLLRSFDMSHRFRNRMCISARLMDMVSDHIDAGVALSKRDFRSSVSLSGQVFEEVLERVEEFTIVGCGMDAAEITQDDFDDAHFRLMINLNRLIKYDRRLRHVRASLLRWNRSSQKMLLF